MSRIDHPKLQAFGSLAGWLQALLAGQKSSACKLQTRANAGKSDNLQALQALCVGAHLRMSVRPGAGAGGQGRAGALTCARVHAPATRKKTKGGNHLEVAAAAFGGLHSGCKPCNPCNLRHGSAA